MKKVSKKQTLSQFASVAINNKAAKAIKGGNAENIIISDVIIA